jgi:hypothetical protein
MRKILLAVSFVALGLGAAIALTPSGARAANADNPYGNVDHSNDAGNTTGDSRVDGLNANQLNHNYQGPLELRPPSGTSTAMPAQPGVVVVPQPGVVVVPPPPAPVTTVR